MAAPESSERDELDKVLAAPPVTKTAKEDLQIQQVDISPYKPKQTEAYDLPLIKIPDENSQVTFSIKWEACYLLTQTCMQGVDVGNEFILPLTSRGVYKLTFQRCEPSSGAEAQNCGNEFTRQYLQDTDASPQYAELVQNSFDISKKMDSLVEETQKNVRAYLQTNPMAKTPDETRFLKLLEKYVDTDPKKLANYYGSQTFKDVENETVKKSSGSSSLPKEKNVVGVVLLLGACVVISIAPPLVGGVLLSRIKPSNPVHRKMVGPLGLIVGAVVGIAASWLVSKSLSNLQLADQMTKAQFEDFLNSQGQKLQALLVEQNKLRQAFAAFH